VFTYSVGNRWSVGSGIGKGFIDDSNPEGKLEFNDGDWSTGITFGYRWGEHIGSSLNAEYNLSRSEYLLSFDLSWSWGF